MTQASKTECILKRIIGGIVIISFSGLCVSFAPHSLFASEAFALDSVSGHPVAVKPKDENKRVETEKDQRKNNSDHLGLDENPLGAVSSEELLQASGTKSSISLKLVNPNADATTKAVYSYLSGLTSRSGDRVVSGQFIGHAAKANSTYFQENYEELVLDLEDVSGEQLGMVGADYAQLTDSNPDIDLELTNQPLIDHWNDGGLVTVSWHARNPWTGKGSRDTSIKGKFLDVMTPGTAAHKAWMKELDAVAAGLAELQSAGVSVLFRPLHESNGNAFWWSKASASEFKAFWKQTYLYLTETKKLNNLLWVYSVVPKISSKDGRREENKNYPGSDYVDMTGLDVYAPSLSTIAPSYQRMLKLGKPFGLTEYGPYKGSDADDDPSLLEPHFSYPVLMNEIRTYMPKAVFFQAWNHGHALVNQLDAGLLLKDPWVTDASDWN